MACRPRRSARLSPSPVYPGGAWRVLPFAISQVASDRSSTRANRNRQGRQGGFSLVEVLVALVVLGVGLLGLAALQITGLRLNDGAMLRTRASLAAYDLSDRIRAEPAAFLGGDGGSAVFVGADGCETLPTASDAASRWQRAFCELGLPKPADGIFAGADCRNSNACGSENCAISVRWSEARTRQPERIAADEDAELLFCTRLAAPL